MVISDSAALRVFRILAISIGIGSAIFITLGIPAMIAQYSALEPSYAWSTIVFYCGLPLLSAVIAPRASIATLRLLARTHALSALFFLLLWIPALNGGTLPLESTPWVNNVIAIAMTTAALSLPTGLAWGYMVCAATVSGLVRYVTYGGGNPALASEDAVMAALFCSVMILLVQLSLQAAREQDIAAAIAEETAVTSASAASARNSRTLYEAFAHDEVLGTLLAASRNVEGTAEFSVNSALRALRKLDAFSDAPPADAPLTAQQLEALFRATAEASDVHLNVVHYGAQAEGILAPSAIGNALAEALGEAIRNSELHAARTDGRAVTRTTRAIFGPTSLRLEVKDDGVGFDQRRIAVDRLGVRISILRRVNSLPGAAATVQSSRRHGTTVILSWNSLEASHAP